MPLRIKCPSGHSLIVSESRAGQTFRCPKCQSEVRVPAAGSAKPPVATDTKRVVPKSATVTPPPQAEKKQAPIGPPPEEKPLGLASSAVTKPAAYSVPTTPKEQIPPPAPPPAVSAVKDIQKAELSPSVEPLAPPVIVPPPDKRLLVQSMLVGTPMSRGPGASEEEPASFLPSSAEPAPPVAPPTLIPESPPPSPLPEQRPVNPPKQHTVPAAPPELPPLVHSDQQVLVAFQLAIGMIVAALFSVFPGAWDLFEYASGNSASPLGRWGIVLGMLGAVQVAYAIYLIQLPDWTTVWMVTLFALASAALYAMALGLTIISGEDGWLVRFLQLSDKVAGGKAALWCLCMMSVMTLLAFFAGRISVRWRQTEAVLREAV